MIYRTMLFLIGTFSEVRDKQRGTQEVRPFSRDWSQLKYPGALKTCLLSLPQDLLFSCIIVFEYFIDSLPLVSLKQWNLAPGLAQELYLQFILRNFCQGEKRSCLSGEYKQYAPVWILITSLSEKGYRNFPLERMSWRFFSSCLVNFLHMYLSGYCSCISLWKFTWHKCTMEANSHRGKML